MPNYDTKAYLTEAYQDFEPDLPAVRFDTDGCDCCSHSEKITDPTIAIERCKATIENLKKRIKGIRTIQNLIAASGYIPKE